MKCSFNIKRLSTFSKRKIQMQEESRDVPFSSKPASTAIESINVASLALEGKTLAIDRLIPEMMPSSCVQSGMSWSKPAQLAKTT